MKRRAFIGTLAGSLLAAPLAAEAQPPGKVWRIGLLDYGLPDPARLAWWKAFQDRLRELGSRAWPPNLLLPSTPDAGPPRARGSQPASAAA